MNLTGLDPDGVGNDGGFIRVDTLLAMIPTTFGIWIDGWNVRGYLIKERALVYAEELDSWPFSRTLWELLLPWQNHTSGPPTALR